MTTSNLGRIAVVSQGDWVAGTYKALDIVRYNGAAYIAKVGTSTVPTNTSYWSLLVNDGTVNYTWIKYADDAIGTGLSNTSTGKSYIGIAVNKNSNTESTIASDYEWTLIKGDKGDTGTAGTNGTNGTGTVNSITAGTGLSGGTITTTGTIALADTAVTAGSYTTANITVDAQGRITAAANGTGGNAGTVTSVAALTLGTTGTDVNSTVATGTTTPVITLNLPNASATARGVLTSADWTTFNTKQEALVSGTNIKTVNGNSLLGSGDITISGGSGGVSTGKAIAMAIVFGG